MARDEPGRRFGGRGGAGRVEAMVVPADEVVGVVAKEASPDELYWAGLLEVRGGVARDEPGRRLWGHPLERGAPLHAHEPRRAQPSHPGRIGRTVLVSNTGVPAALPAARPQELLAGLPALEWLPEGPLTSLALNATLRQYAPGQVRTCL